MAELAKSYWRSSTPLTTTSQLTQHRPFTPSVPIDFDFNSLYRLFLGNDPAPTASSSPPTSTASPGPPRSPEHYRLLGANHFVTLERWPSPIFGIASRGAHLTAYVGRGRDMKIWIAHRSKRIFTYPGKLDSSVAGGIKADDTPRECITAEAWEEASLDRDFVRDNVKATGMVSYVGENKRNGTIQPVVLYVYDLEMPEDMELKPQDDEVEFFSLMSVDEVRNAMLEYKFKPNCCLVMIDFFVRHGIMTDENEEDYLELITRLRRTLPVPLSPSKRVVE
ncbi:unnamed protein product [Parascedosporium putredinis]|uniref:Nudix hydrolase domain-containing protein n=1 Tax=Parascedosporium putredinis TaxID=1442378 RepID=A0A9P1MBP2_9PEZI|nr:unnamed protein product [Parascedosporium putredinis]CAI7996196.1 unnamed protein product [Parascedosporium putredinis]